MQMSQDSWTSGSPLAWQYFDTSHMKHHNWKLSFDQYIKFLNWYQIMLQKTRNTEKWKQDDFLSKHNASFISTKKAALINSLIAVENETKAKQDTCVMMLLWHTTYTHWIQTPCDFPALDKASIFCNSASKVQNNAKTTNVSVHVDQNKGGQKDISNTFQCRNGVHISSLFLCNLRHNCTNNEDEMMCETLISGIDTKSLLFKDKFLSFSAQNSSVRTQTVQKHLNISCSSPNINCIYDVSDRKLDRTQKYCSSGRHLGQCEKVLCNTTFKCPNYYCLPWRFVCDGYWDCPLGYDEDNCNRRSLPGLYHCSSGVIYIMLHSLCDDIFDCPERDDEENCDLNNTFCPAKCSCFRYSLRCSSFTIHDDHQIENMPHIFVILSGNLLMNQLLSTLSHFKSLIDLTLDSHNLKEFCLSNTYQLSQLIHLNVSKNHIFRINSHCFHSTPNLIVLNMSNNKIHQIDCEAFSEANNIETYILTQNNLTELKQCIFDTFLKLKYLDLCGNDILFNDKNLFSTIPTTSLYVKSLDYLVCCYKGNIKCSEQRDIQTLQCSFLQGQYLNTAIWIVSSLGLITNAISFFVFVAGLNADKDQKTAFKYLGIFLFLSHLFFCKYLFLAASIDAHFNDNYAFARPLWHQTLLCHFLCFLFLFSVWECFISNNLMVTARLMVVHYPIKSMFRRSSPVKRLLLKISFIPFLLALLCGIKYNGQHFSEGLCLPLGHLGHSTLSVSVTILFITFGVISSIFQPAAYAKIIAKVKETHAAVSLENETVQKSLTKTACLSSVCNILCWLSTAILWSIFLFAQERSGKLLVTWSLVATVPINIIIFPFILGV